MAEMPEIHVVAGSGMELRDYFAAQALKGILSSCLPDGDYNYELITHEAYCIADAMLGQREAK